MNLPQRPARRANALPDVRPVNDCTPLQSISAEPPVPRLSTSSIPRWRTSGPKIPRYSTRVPVDGYPGPPSTATIGGPVGVFGARYQRNAMSIRRPVGFAGSAAARASRSTRLPHERSVSDPTFSVSARAVSGERQEHDHHEQSAHHGDGRLCEVVTQRRRTTLVTTSSAS